MEYRNLDLTLISATGLKEVNKFRKMEVYATVYIHGYPKTKKKTKTDKDCGTNPTWNEHMQFIIDEHSLMASGLNLVVQFKADVMGPDKEIGEVAIPIPKLFDDCGKTPGVERSMDYKVMTSGGKVKGTLKMSFMFGEKYRSNIGSDASSNNSPKMFPTGYGQQPTPNMATPPNNTPYYPGMEHHPPQHGVPAYPYPGASPSSGYYPPHQYSPPLTPSSGYPSGYQSHPQGSYSHQGHYGAYPPAGGHPQHIASDGYNGYAAPASGAGYASSPGAGYASNGYGGYSAPATGAGYMSNGYGGYGAPAYGGEHKTNGYGGYDAKASGAGYTSNGYGGYAAAPAMGYPQKQQPPKKEKKKSKRGMFAGLGVLGVGAGLIGGLILGEEMGDAFSGVGDMFSGAGEAAMGAAGDVVSGAGEMVGDVAAGAGDAVLGAAGDVVAGAGDMVVGAGDAVLGAAGDAVAGVGDMAAGAVAGAAGDVISGAGEAVVGAGEAVSGLAR